MSSEKPIPSQQIPIAPVIDMKSFMDMVTKTEDKTKITALLELLNEKNLELITEYPSTAYTKLATKLMTYRTTMIDVLNLDDGMRLNEKTNVYEYHPELDDTDYLIKEMMHQFMLKMTSHKRRRAIEIINALRNDEANTNIFTNENKGVRRFFGMK